MRIRLANPADSTEICNLLAQAAHHSSELIWHDRSPDFFGLYHHFPAGHPRHWVAVDDADRIHGVISAVEVPQRGLYINDFYRRPDSPLSRVGHALFSAVLDQKPKVLFALENTAGALRGTARMARRLGYRVDSSRVSTLYEATCAKAVEVNHAKKIPILEAAQWPLHIRSELQTLDPGALAFIADDAAAGILSVNMNRVRKTKLTPRARRLMNVTDDLVHYQTLSMPWGQGESLANVIRAATWSARQNGCAMVGVRDLPTTASAKLSEFQRHDRRLIVASRAGPSPEKFSLDAAFA